ncbi:MAG: hypothetical protein ABIJ16_13115 [Bacteroidota bacterium]
MKTLKTICALLLISGTIYSQSPQSFKYQAVIRDATGLVVPDQNVGIRISILQGSVSGPSVYEETHAPTTNSFGLVNLEIGGGSVVSGDFAAIPWGTDQFFVQIELDETGGTNYQLMGVSQLLSVPYALYAEKAGITDSTLWKISMNDIYYDDGNVRVGTGTVNSVGRLQVMSDTTATVNDVIFSVQNAAGDTVFAVYQEGVRIWVSDDTTGSKATGSRGGFAVGGFNPSKALTNEYLRVTPDSVRIYIEDGSGGSKATGSRGGFAVGGFNPSKAFTNEYLRVTEDSSRVWTNGNGGFQIQDIATGSTNYLNLTPENYFIGHEAGINNVNGLFNSVLGYRGGSNLTVGDSNVFIGFYSGYNETNGYNNIYIGTNTGYGHAGVFNNVAIGNGAFEFGSLGTGNTIMGYQSGSKMTGDGNLCLGYKSGDMGFFTGSWNVILGHMCGREITTGYSNTIVGSESGYHITTGTKNVIFGYKSGYETLIGIKNVYIGNNAGYNNNGQCNVFIGNNSGYGSSVSDGSYNVFFGNECGRSITTASDNIAIGSGAAFNLTTGTKNVFLGNDAGFSNTIGVNNVFLGPGSGYFETGSNKLYIANSNTTEPLIFGDFIENKVTITDVLNLRPRSSFPPIPVNGDLFYNSTDHHIYCYVNGVWKQLDN